MHDLDTPPESIVPESHLEWYIKKCRASGITSEIARKCGIELRAGVSESEHEKTGLDYPYIHIPYSMPDCTPTTFYRRRVLDTYLSKPISYEERKSGRAGGKYRNPKGQRNRVYWPTIEDQSAKLQDISAPLLICEGEFKSICAQSMALASGIKMVVCGIGGVAVDAEMLKAFRSMPLRVTINGEEYQRPVLIAMDWNGKGDSREHSHSAELILARYFKELGAEPLLLRWPADDSAGEQKLDDWLVGGGDLKVALDYSIGLHTKTKQELQRFWDRYNEEYVIFGGKFVPVRNHGHRYGKEQFETIESEQYIDVEGLYGRKNTIFAARAIWGKQPKKDRNIVDGFTFAPYPMGVEPEQYVWREGKRMFNVAPPWPGEPMLWAEDVAPESVAPFLWLIGQLARGHDDWLVKFFAHSAQRPWERGHHVLVLSDDGGTGKGRLLDTMRRVFGNYCSLVGNAFKNDFNGHLESAVLAFWSEPESHGRKDVTVNALMKNYSGDTEQMINNKYGNQYIVPNYGRLIVLTNNEYVTAYDRNDRRLVVMGGDRPLTTPESKEYMNWMEGGGWREIQKYLVNLPLDGFEPFARGPITDKWELGIKGSAPRIIQFLEEECMQEKDIWTAEAILDMYRTRYGSTPISVISLGKELIKSGMTVRQINNKRTGTPDGRQRNIKFFALRGKWEERSNDEWLDEAKMPKY